MRPPRHDIGDGGRLRRAQHDRQMGLLAGAALLGVALVAPVSGGDVTRLLGLLAALPIVAVTLLRRLRGGAADGWHEAVAPRAGCLRELARGRERGRVIALPGRVQVSGLLGRLPVEARTATDLSRPPPQDDLELRVRTLTPPPWRCVLGRAFRSEGLVGQRRRPSWYVVAGEPSLAPPLAGEAEARLVELLHRPGAVEVELDAEGLVLRVEADARAWAPGAARALLEELGGLGELLGLRLGGVELVAHVADRGRTTCPYCHGSLDEEPRRCAECATPHHAACFEEHGGCTVLGCKGRPDPDRARC